MKVLHVIARVNLGGTARWLETLTAEQIRAGDEVVVATGRVQGEEVEDPDASLMPLVRIDHLGRSVSPSQDLVALRQLRNLILDWRPDVINTHTAKAGTVGRVAGLSLGRRRPALVHTVHGHLLKGYFSRTATQGVSMAERLLSTASDLVLAAGQRVRDDLVTARVVPEHKVVVVRPGVPDFPRKVQREALQELGLGSFPQDQVVAGWLARIVKVKRPDRLVGAALETRDIQYLVGGDGELRVGLNERAPDNVHILGWTNAASFWSACNLAVLTSDNEAMPYSLVEAALAGLPAVTTDAGSASEVVVHGVTGFVVQPSAQAVSEGVAKLVSDPDTMAAMGKAARERALTEFSPHRMLLEHQAAYVEAIGRRGASVR